MDKKRQRDWCFTINNYSQRDIDVLEALASSVVYLIYGREVGEKEQTPHLQCYVYFKAVKSFQQVKRLVERAHIQPSRGTPKQNFIYCSKEKNYTEHGTIPLSQEAKGEKGAEYWNEQLALAKAGKLEEIDSKLLFTHFSTILKISRHFAIMPLDSIELDNFWYYGETGTGKSRSARSIAPKAYLKMCNKWWDGYEGEEDILIEDFDKSHHVLGHHLKIWSDRYAFPAEVKGSKINIRPKRIIVTSNYSPGEIWGHEPNTLEPLLRRFKVTHFDSMFTNKFDF